MTYVVTEACIRCKYMDCVSICPVDCFHAGEHMLVIHPDECIDCGVCEPACPAAAIVSDAAPEAAAWLPINAELARLWPTIHAKGEPPEDADRWKGVAGKYQMFFSKDSQSSGRDPNDPA